MPEATQMPQIDVRTLEPRSRRTQVFAAFDRLEVGQTLEVVSDHEPQTLRSQFELERPQGFTWEALEAGPEVWRVAINKLKARHGHGSCCGACGG